MDGDGDDFSQPDLPFPAAGINFFSQSESYQGSRAGMQALDLNSQADEFPDINSYSDFLRGDFDRVGRGRGARTLGLRVARNGAEGSRGGGAGGSRGGGASLAGGSGIKGGGAGGSKGCVAGGSRGGGASRAGGSGFNISGGRGAPRSLFTAPAPDGAAGGGGRGGGRVGGRRRGGANADEDGFFYVGEGNVPEGGDGVEVIFPGSQIKGDKASWSELNTNLFCDLCVEQIRAGNCHKGTMSARGYKTISEKYYLATGLKHDRRQLRNRIYGLKTLYTFWMNLQKRSGLGRARNGSVTATNEWWEENTKGAKSECKKLRNGPLEYIDQLEEMFHDVVVDGSTSFTPGGEEEAEDDDEGKEEEEADQLPFVDYDSPMNTNTRKRANTNSSKSTASSPGKKSKSHMVNVMDNLVSKWAESDEKQNKMLRKKVNENASKEMKERAEMKKCQQLALESGAAPDSVEFFACLTIFKESMNREFFCNIPSAESRLVFL